MTLPSLFGRLAPLWVLQLNRWIAYFWLATACILVATCFILEARRRSFRWLPVYALLLALQPGWDSLYQELVRGNFHVQADCGYPARAQSLFLFAAPVAVALLIARRSPLSRRSFVFGLAVALLLMSIVDALYLFTPVSSFFPESRWVEEIRQTIVAGVSMPWPPQLIVLGVICAGLHYFRRLRFLRVV